MANAPGWPGIEPRWTSSAKAGVGTALSALSRVWFTFSHGILNEVYYPRVDQACTRDCGLIVTDGIPGGYFSEEKRDTDSAVTTIEPGVPDFVLRNVSRDGRYVIEKRIISDPWRDVVLQQIRLLPGTQPEGERLRLFVLLSPHLVNGGAHNTAWLGEYKGQQMLLAEGDGTCLAMGCSAPFLARAAGFAGSSDGWQDLSQHGRLTWLNDRAADGNVALTGEIDVSGDAPIVLALGFGRYWAEAAFRARASIQRGFPKAETEYAAAWRAWQTPLAKLDEVADGSTSIYRISTAVMRAHDSPAFPGGIIASLSIPWGFNKGDDDLGGYHLVWPRDLGETAGGLLACGALGDARRVLAHLRAIQEPDGHWPQNVWLDGLAYWRGIQLDETAFPILLVEMAYRLAAIGDVDMPSYWEMVRNAAGFVVRNGPMTGQDRWEENAGFSPFTLAVEIPALLAAADFAEREGNAGIAEFLRDTADAWNDEIETWTYVTGTTLAGEAGVDGYYLRIAPLDGSRVTVRNRPPHDAEIAAADLVSPDALALVRFGLRDANDPRIRNTVAVIDRLLRVELPQGPGWHRYNGDGYGEHPDGSAFDGTGQGRAWPLLIGERAHYELAAGRPEEARRLLATMEACASPGGMLPEQVWDADDIPERELFRGAPSGSAMPLVWAHAEHVKLLRSLADGALFDMPPQSMQRYLKEQRRGRLRCWREDWRRDTLPHGLALRVELSQPGTVHWSADGWRTARDIDTADVGLGVNAAEIPTADLQPGEQLVFTWRRRDGAWRGENVTVAII